MVLKEKKKKGKGNVFYVDLRVAHHQLAHSCLSLVLDSLQFNICKLESSYLANKDVEDLEVRIVRHLPPALSYACRFWHYHLGHLDFETDLFGKLQTFFEKKFLFWLEALSLTSDMGLASPAFLSLSEWLASGQGVSVEMWCVVCAHARNTSVSGTDLVACPSWDALVACR